MLSIWSLPLLLLPTLLGVSSALPANLHQGNGHNRTIRELDCNDDEYWHTGHCCKNCPAGTHASVHCTVNHGHGVCEACTRGEDFTESPNGLETCLSCLTCTHDKVLVRECTPEANAECECKRGYYCSPNQSCQICSRCSRCGEGQQIKNPCTPTTDTVCEDVSAPDPTSTKANVNKKPTVLEPNDSFNDTTRRKELTTNPLDDQTESQSDLKIILTIVGCLVFILIIIFVGYTCYRRRANNNKKNSLLGITQNSENTSLNSVRTEDIKDPKEEELPPEHQPLVTPKPGRIEQQIHQMAEPCLVQAQREKSDAESSKGDMESEESPQVGALCEECHKPQPCDDQWVDFFYIVIDSVQPDRMLQLVRKLHLPRTTIDQIVKDNPNDCRERSYKLLDQWRNQKGKQASMTAVLEVLHLMDLGGCGENIVNDLRTKKIPIN